ncbi:histidine kinase [Dyadobacter sp. CY345]|uniref:sensor histidine kinase n=1 Tax=Dyadobacter sp. CY345 TaxID=2909335 RepID=UPI001F34F543|nr:histidine kinase [Dyadobacter sp. CY345]MCF2442838.1 histidine kinase [Dyadobacter sp. CY345]
MSPSTKGSKKFWNFSPSFFGVNIIIAAAITFSFCPSCLLSKEGLIRSIDNFASSFLVSCVLSYGGFLFEYYFDRKMPWIKYPVQRLILETSGYLLYVFIASIILSFLFGTFVYDSIDLKNIPWDELISDTIIPLKISIVISVILISRSFLLEWRKSAIEAEQLKTQQYAQQYQTLKDQLNPHFLFNSLNVLSNLVYENPDTAVKFIRQLSKIYRYVLEVQQEKLVELSGELEFAENFLSLQKIRFEEGLLYRINLGEQLDFFLPPLSLQMLLENAIKHNIASQANPLIIDILMEENKLVVKNNLQLKSSLSEESTGIGLSNIRKRYELMSSKPIEIEESLTSFVVRLPLLTAKEL